MAKLTFLENAHAGAIVCFLAPTPEERQAVVDRIIEHGGPFDVPGKFVEVAP